jgi:diguanylate cyclase (GGDEF)-like protein
MNLDRGYSIPGDDSQPHHKLQIQLNTVLNQVPLGLVLIDPDGSSLVNPVAARLLDIAPGPVKSNEVGEAIAKRRGTWRVHKSTGLDVPQLNPGARDMEFWELPENGGMIEVESRPFENCGARGWLWIFTDITAIWTLGINLQQSVSTLQVLNRELDREVKQRLDIEEQLREYNAELERRRRAVERRAVQSARLADLLTQEKRELELSKQESDFLANHDRLTGLLNRRGFEQRLQSMVDTDNKENAATAVMFIDLDGFKAVNDTLGHEAGDTLLKEAATRLTGILRDTDLVARFGGDEFVIATSHAEEPGPSGLRMLADRVRDTLQIEVAGPGGEIQVAATLGVAAAPHDGETIETLLDHADQAMYVGKRRGRNAVVFYADLSKQS